MRHLVNPDTAIRFFTVPGLKGTRRRKLSDRMFLQETDILPLAAGPPRAMLDRFSRPDGGSSADGKPDQITYRNQKRADRDRRERSRKTCTAPGQAELQ